MRRLSKVAILGLVATAIGGELFAPPIPPVSIEELERRIITGSTSVIGREWKEDEIRSFHTTHIIPVDIKKLLTEDQIKEFLGGGAFGVTYYAQLERAATGEA